MDPVDADGAEPVRPAPPAAALRVLVVDDCPAVLRFVERALAGAGHVVACHDDPRTALAGYQQAGDQIDLVITDYSMPHLNGLQLVEAMRAARAGGAFLMITADGPPAHRPGAACAGHRAAAAQAVLRGRPAGGRAGRVGRCAGVLTGRGRKESKAT
jgi:CheY-like chemotaxis protein